MICCRRFIETPEPLSFFFGTCTVIHSVITYREGLNPFGLRILQIVDFGTTSGAERSSEPQIGIFDFQLFGLQVFAPMDFFAENRKSLKRFGKRPAPARSGPKIKAVLPPSHLIGRARMYNENSTLALAIRVEGGLHGPIYYHSVFHRFLSKDGGEEDEGKMVLYMSYLA